MVFGDGLRSFPFRLRNRFARQARMWAVPFASRPIPRQADGWMPRKPKGGGHRATDHPFASEGVRGRRRRRRREAGARRLFARALRRREEAVQLKAAIKMYNWLDF